MSRRTRSTCSCVRAGGDGDVARRDAVVQAVQAQVHLRVGQREVELLLRLRQRVGVGGGRPAADLGGNAEELGHRVHLGLVQVRDRLDVGRTVAEFHEEPLVVLEAVRRARRDVVQRVRVVVLEHLAGALLEVVGRQNPQVGVDRQPGAGTGRRPGPRRRWSTAAASRSPPRALQDELRLPFRAVLGNHLADGVVVAAVAAERVQDAGELLQRGPDAQVVGDGCAQSDRLGCGRAFGHVQAEHPLRADRTDAERRRHAGVDATRQCDDGALASGRDQVVPDALGDAVGFGLEVQREAVGAEGWCVVMG